ncbi:MAG: phosphatase PAP2 family protein [Acidobacteriaceae bacterium]
MSTTPLQPVPSPSRAAAMPPPARSARRFTLVMTALVAVLLPTEFFLGRPLRVVRFGVTPNVVAGLLLIAALVAYCRWRPLPRLVESCTLALWTAFLANALSVLIQIAGRSPRPLIDAQLARMDGRLHFQTAAVVRFAAHLPSLSIALGMVYELVGAFILAAVLLLPFLGYAEAARRYVMSAAFGIVIAAIVFAFWPAAGPWTTEAFRPNPFQADVTAYLALLKSHAPVALDMKRAAIVAFPSIHVLLALLSAVALSSIRRLRIVIWILAIAMCFSTLTTGWHYLMDVFGGIGLTVIAVALARVALPSDPPTPS